MENKMNPEVKAQVVEALRSGKYIKGEGALNENGCFCVWGVISDLSGKDEWVESSIEGTKRYGEDGDVAYPVPAVREWAGIDYKTVVTIGGIEQPLMDHNDHGATFEQLADAIEQQL